MERQGYSYDGANASFELLARRVLENVPQYFRMAHFKVFDYRKWSSKGELMMESKAVANVEVNGVEIKKVARGNGPVSALDKAIHRALDKIYPEIKGIKLVDYRVRIINPEQGTSAVTRVTIESEDGDGNRWSTVGVSPNVIDASYNALRDSLMYKILKSGKRK